MNEPDVLGRDTHGPPWTGPVGLGLLIGTGVGLLEVACLWCWPSRVVTREYIVIGAILYAVGGLLCGLTVTVLGALIRRRLPSVSLSLAVTLSFFGFIITAGYVNVYHLPQATSPHSLLATAGMLAAFGLVGLGLFRLFRRMGNMPLGRKLDRWQS